MTITEAQKIFGLDNSASQESILETIESKLFTLKQEILQKYMVPSLLKYKLALLRQLSEAENLIDPGNSHAIDTQHPWTTQPDDRVDFLEQYEQRLSQIKLDVMNSQNFSTFTAATESLILCQEYFMVLFKLFFSDHYEALPEEVNTREIIDTGRLLVFIKNPDEKTDMSWAIEKELARIDKIQRLK